MSYHYVDRFNKARIHKATFYDSDGSCYISHWCFVDDYLPATLKSLNWVLTCILSILKLTANDITIYWFAQ